MGYAIQWRPGRFSEIKGQDLNVKVMQGLIAAGMPERSLILHGHFGSGKSTLARVTAKRLNCANVKDNEPCCQCEICNDIQVGKSRDCYLEIDGATAGNVANIRKIIDLMSYPPMEGTKKVILIDEAHALSRDAFMACLKNIEEPPEYVVIMFVTTELEKIPEMIQSRCFRLKFGRIKITDVVGRLQQIVEKEKIKAELPELKLLAEVTGGTMRDSIILLEQVYTTFGEVTNETVQKLIGWGARGSPSEVLKLIISGDIKEISEAGKFLSGGGVSLYGFKNVLMRLVYEEWCRRVGVISAVEIDSRVLEICTPDEIRFLIGELAQLDINNVWLFVSKLLSVTLSFKEKK